MTSLGLNRYALAMGAASALLAGCGGSQPPIDGLGTMPQSRAVAGHGDRGRSWRRNTSSGDLIYVTGPTQTYVISYVDGTPSKRFPTPPLAYAPIPQAMFLYQTSTWGICTRTNNADCRVERSWLRPDWVCGRSNKWRPSRRELQSKSGK